MDRPLARRPRWISYNRKQFSFQFAILSSSSSALPQPELATLFSAHHPWLLGRLYSRLRNRAEAEDVASETFVRVIDAGRAQQLREPRAYLTTVAKNVLLQSWRRRDLERAYLEALAAAPPAFALSVEEHLVLLETLTRINAALDGLPAKARRAFLLSQLDGMTYADIATELQVSASTVRYYMAQGLRRCMEAAGDTVVAP